MVSEEKGLIVVVSKDKKLLLVLAMFRQFFFRSIYAVILLNLSIQLYADTLRVGFGSNRPPYVISETHRGIEVDIVSHVLRELGHQIEPVYITNQELQLNFSDYNLDLATSLREKYDFKNLYYSAPYIEHTNIVVSKTSNVKTIKSMADFSGYRVGAWQLARIDLGPDFKVIADQLGPYYFEYKNQCDQNIAFWSGNVDIMIIDRIMFFWMKKMLSDHIDTQALVEITSIFPAIVEFRVGFHSRSLRDDFDEGLSRLRREGGYQKIINHYIGDISH